jgi:hypothetical protein
MKERGHEGNWQNVFLRKCGEGQGMQGIHQVAQRVPALGRAVNERDST